MAASDFEQWLAGLLGQSEFEVKRLLRDRAALQFLIAWALFESKCFGGFVKIDQLEVFANRTTSKESFDVNLIAEAAKHFHGRYQNKTLYRHLMHRQSSSKMSELLEKPFDSLLPQETVFLVALTGYRFRNNMFHGNKGVDTWLQYKEQICLCTRAMQTFVSHAESLVPSMNLNRSA